MDKTAASPIEPPADRYCDLVMKGGITSGVVYPVAISRLSRHYRFKSIGGTSAGAIAAAVTAAAEHQRLPQLERGRRTPGPTPMMVASRHGFPLSRPSS